MPMVIGIAIRHFGPWAQDLPPQYDVAMNTAPGQLTSNGEPSRFGTVLGVSHGVLAEVASRAARVGAIEHVRAGRLPVGDVHALDIAQPALIDTRRGLANVRSEERLVGRRPQSARCVDPPGKGRFDKGVGTFYSDYIDIDNGKAMRVRYTWSHITPTSARWEQAHSSDGGKTWDTNWIMEFRRMS
jgi:hypothetical protein